MDLDGCMEDTRSCRRLGRVEKSRAREVGVTQFGDYGRFEQRQSCLRSIYLLFISDNIKI